MLSSDDLTRMKMKAVVASGIPWGPMALFPETKGRVPDGYDWSAQYNRDVLLLAQEVERLTIIVHAMKAREESFMEAFVRLQASMQAQSAPQEPAHPAVEAPAAPPAEPEAATPDST